MTVYIYIYIYVKPDNSNSHEFELHRPSNKGTKLLLKVIKAIIIIYIYTYIRMHDRCPLPHASSQSRSLARWLIPPLSCSPTPSFSLSLSESQNTRHIFQYKNIILPLASHSF